MSPRTRILLRLILSLASTVLFIAVLEGITRLFWYRVEEGGSCTAPDPNLVHRNQPDCQYRHKTTEGEQVISYAINACGFRDPRPCDSYQPGHHLAFAIGDSFTFGSMVPEQQTYVRVAEQLMRSRGESVDYVNAGVGGWDLYQYSLALPGVLARKPELVTIGLLPNDLFADISKSSIRQRQELIKTLKANELYQQIYVAQRPLLERFTKSVMGRSHLVDLLTHLMLSQDALYAAIYQRRSEDSFLRKDYSPAWQQKIADAERILGEMAKRASENNVRLAVIAIPQRIQALVISNREKFPALEATAFSTHLSEVCARLGIDYVDFIEYLGQHHSPTSLYYPIDGHLTPEGQMALGRYVGEHLKLNINSP